MTERMTADEFLGAEGVEDWRVLPSGEAATYFKSGKFRVGVALVVESGRLADAAKHHPGVDPRDPRLTARITAPSASGLTSRAPDPARGTCAAAPELGVAAGPSAP